MAEKNGLRQAVLQRFLPATGSVYLGVLTAMAIAEPGGLSWIALGVAGTSTILITAGFATVAGLFRSALRPTVRLGRRSLVAGFVAPLALGALSIFTQGASDATIAVLTFTAGALTGVGTLGPGVLKGREQEPLDPEVQVELERLEADLALVSSAEYTPMLDDAPMTGLRPANPVPVERQR